MPAAISVIIPVYNQATRLARCLDSVLRQTLGDLEILVVDDGSTDGSPAMIDHYAGNDPRIKAIHQRNGGPSAARNAGLRVASGSYIAFVDSDDYLEERMLEVLWQQARQHDAELTICGFICETYQDGILVYHRTYQPVADPEGVVVLERHTLQQQFARLFEVGVIHSPCNKLYARALIARLGARFDETLSLGEDLLFNMRLLEQVERCVLIGMPGYHYVVGETTLASKYRADMFPIKLRLHREVLAHLHAWNCADDEHYQFVTRFFFQEVLQSVTNVMDPANTATFFTKAREIARMLAMPEVSRLLAVRQVPFESWQERICFLAMKYRLLPVVLALAVHANRKSRNR